jgi:arylsulfatase
LFDEVFDTSDYDPARSTGGRYRANVPFDLHQTTWCSGRAVDFIRDHGLDGTRKNQPWLYSVNIFDPHPAFDAPLDYEKRYDPASLPPPLFRESDLITQERLADSFFQQK